MKPTLSKLSVGAAHYTVQDDRNFEPVDEIQVLCFVA